MTVHVRQLETPHGPARAHVRVPDSSAPTGLLVLGPGASGSIATADLALAVRLAVGPGWAGVLVEPAYAVAGRTVPPRGTAPDEAFAAVVEQLRAEVPGPLVTGGRSFGGRVACRTSGLLAPDGVLCLAFPEHPPGRPDRSRQAELSAVTVPTLVVQGASDPFGRPTATEAAEVVVVPGDHSLKAGLAEAEPVIAAFLARWAG